MNAEEFNRIMTEAANSVYNKELSKPNGSYIDPYLFFLTPEEFKIVQPYLDPENKYCTNDGWVKAVVYDIKRILE